MKRSSRAGEHARRTRGLRAATIVGWGLIVTPSLASMLLESHPDTPETAVGLVLGIFVPVAIIGLPVSLIFCFFLGDLAWSLAEHHGRAARRGALMVGGMLRHRPLRAVGTVTTLASGTSSVPNAWPMWRPEVWVFAMAIGGLPLSLIFCFSGGYPAWLIATRLGMKRRRDAMIVGALLGLVVAGLLAFLRIATGLGTHPSGHEPLTRILILYPGVVLYVTATGVVAGLAAWGAAGKKSDSRKEMAWVFA